jgi:hypothetical protein
MWGEVVAATIALVGAAMGSVITAAVQVKTSRADAKAELDRLRLQLREEAAAARRAKKEEWVLDAVAQLVAASDVEQRTIDYTKIVPLILRVQLVLNVENPAEARLNHCTTDLGITVRNYVAGRARQESLLGASDRLIDAVRAFVNQGERPTPPQFAGAPTGSDAVQLA